MGFMRFGGAAAVGVVAMLAMSVSDAWGCRCGVPGPPCEVYWTTDVIFRGRVEAIERPAGYADDPAKRVIVRFGVLEAFKGVDSGQVEVWSPIGPASCAYRFRKGGEYVVYALHGNGRIFTNACSRTRPVGRAQGDLEYARSIAAGGIPAGRISGRVRLFNLELLTGRHRTRGMADVPVTVAGERATATLMTNRGGEFAVGGLEAGTYEIMLALSGHFRVELAPSRVQLRDARACATTEVGVYPDGRVTGRVTDGSGKPIRGLTLELTTPDPGGRIPRPQRLQTVTGRDGAYEFSGVPSGKFVLGMNIGPDPADADGRAFYPDAGGPDRADILDLPPGGQLVLPDFVVPPDIMLVEIAGVVFDPDGGPVEGARVYLRGPAERDFILTAPVITDRSGRFSIAAVAHQDYRLFAERTRRDRSGRVDFTGLVPIVAASPQVPLTLTLRSLH